MEFLEFSSLGATRHAKKDLDQHACHYKYHHSRRDGSFSDLGCSRPFDLGSGNMMVQPGISATSGERRKGPATNAEVTLCVCVRDCCVDVQRRWTRVLARSLRKASYPASRVRLCTEQPGALWNISDNDEDICERDVCALAVAVVEARAESGEECTSRRRVVGEEDGSSARVIHLPHCWNSPMRWQRQLLPHKLHRHELLPQQSLGFWSQFPPLGTQARLQAYNTHEERVTALTCTPTENQRILAYGERDGRKHSPGGRINCPAACSKTIFPKLARSCARYVLVWCRAIGKFWSVGAREESHLTTSVSGHVQGERNIAYDRSCTHPGYHIPNAVYSLWLIVKDELGVLTFRRTATGRARPDPSRRPGSRVHLQQQRTNHVQSVAARVTLELQKEKATDHVIMTAALAMDELTLRTHAVDGTWPTSSTSMVEAHIYSYSRTAAVRTKLKYRPPTGFGIFGSNVSYVETDTCLCFMLLATVVYMGLRSSVLDECRLTLEGFRSTYAWLHHHLPRSETGFIRLRWLLVSDRDFEPPISEVRNELHLDLQPSSELEWCKQFSVSILDPISDRCCVLAKVNPRIAVPQSSDRCPSRVSMLSAARWGRGWPRKNSISLHTACQSKYGNRIRLERVSQKESSDTHKTPYDRVKRCRERKINIKESERVNVDVFTQSKRPCPHHSHTPFFQSSVSQSIRSNIYTQCDENTARQFRALCLAAMRHLMCVALSSLCLPRGLRLLIASRLGEPDSILGRGRSRIFAYGNRAGRCRWSAGIHIDLPFPPPLHSGAAPYTPRLTLIDSQDLVVKSRPNISTHSRKAGALRSRSTSFNSAPALLQTYRRIYTLNYGNGSENMVPSLPIGTTVVLQRDAALQDWKRHHVDQSPSASTRTIARAMGLEAG
ncbi:hypothetical protein PR048_024331 [Dryococelus australis]|uniref:Uncharacterized protein n=1 Tax=Dryococelus australis TaxID=614101 RepID=A0ABQ9GN99_9NEOP|nr:hypothetical protein PR048_024331 [Dryococelus australis]